MPALSFSLVHGAATDVGLRRAVNEDSLYAVDPLFAVADGMGGHEAGEVASSLCVQVLSADAGLSDTATATTPAQLHAVIDAADLRIRDVGESRAGTTLSGVLLTQEAGKPHWLVFNIGDSRTYCLSESKLRQISVDHSAVQELVELGQLTASDARIHPRRNVVTRALGTGPRVGADTWLLPAQAGDRMLICSDGLTSEVEDEQIEHLLHSLSGAQDAADALMQAALRSGGRDNISVIVIDAVPV